MIQHSTLPMPMPKPILRRRDVFAWLTGEGFTPWTIRSFLADGTISPHAVPRATGRRAALARVTRHYYHRDTIIATLNLKCEISKPNQ